MPRAAPRNAAEIHAAADDLARAAAADPALASDLRELWDDALTVLRSLLEHGTTEDRLSVVKVLTPVMKELGFAGAGDGSGIAADEKARQILMGNWDHIKGTIREEP